MIRTNPKKVVDKLQAMIGKILVQKRMIVSFTSDKKAYEAAKPIMEKYITRIAPGRAGSDQA